MNADQTVTTDKNGVYQFTKVPTHFVVDGTDQLAYYRICAAVPAGYALSGCAGASPLLPDGGSFCPAPILRRMLSIFYVILCNDLRLIIFPQKGTRISKTRFSLCGHRRNAPADAGGLRPLRLRGLRNLPEISRSSRISQRWCCQQRTGRCWSWWERPCPRSS